MEGLNVLFQRIIVSKWSMRAVQSALCFSLPIKTSVMQTSGQSSSTGSNICYSSAATGLCVCNSAGVPPGIHTQMLEIDIITSFVLIVLLGGTSE